MNVLFLFLFSLAEAVAYARFLGAFALARGGLARRALWTVLAAGAYTLLLLAIRANSHTWYHGTLHFLLTAGLMRRMTGRGASDCLYLAVVVDGATRFLEHLIGNLTVIWWGGVLFLYEGPWALCLASDAAVFLVYCASLYGAGRWLRLDRFGGASGRISGMLAAFYLMLVALNDLTVRLMQMVNLGGYQLAALAIIEGAWYAMCLTMLFGVNAMTQFVEKQREVLGMEALMRMQNSQYALEKESAERVARLSHDMRGHLNALRAIEDGQTRNDYIQRLSRDLGQMEKPCDTGNEALDVIARDRIAQCEKADIRLALLADGRLLDFMALPDVVALFSNALDNAIDAARRLDDPARREITLRMSRVRGWLVLRVENWYSGVLREEQGRLMTTKEVGALHGYGMKSIEHVARKYAGQVSYAARDGRFTLTVAIPDRPDAAPAPSG